MGVNIGVGWGEYREWVGVYIVVATGVRYVLWGLGCVNIGRWEVNMG